MTRMTSSTLALAAACVAAATVSFPAHAQGVTRTLDDLRTEYRQQCGKNGSRERLLVAYDRAIRIAPGPASRKHLTAQRAAVANPREPICPEPLTTAPGTSGPITVPVSTPPATAEDVCRRPAPNPRAAECARFKLLLGRFASRRYGAEIETVLTPAGTITGTIVRDSKRGRDNGYNTGMVVLRGWKPALSGGTWLVTARGGDTFLSNVYNREPDTVWSPGGVIYVAKAAPNVLQFPSGLQLRLAETDQWVRVGNP